jgi:hypothetical protein
MLAYHAPSMQITAAVALGLGDVKRSCSSLSLHRLLLRAEQITWEFLMSPFHHTSQLLCFRQRTTLV